MVSPLYLGLLRGRAAVLTFSNTLVLPILDPALQGLDPYSELQSLHTSGLRNYF